MCTAIARTAIYTANYFDPPGNLRAGERLFREKKCVVCHQVGGTGGVIGPDLDFLGQYGSPILFATAMWNHGSGMAEAMRARRLARPSLTDSELVDLLAYLKSGSRALVTGPLYVLPGRADAGRKLFGEKRCLDCHGESERGRLGPDLQDRQLVRDLTQFAARMWNKAPAMMKTMRAQRVDVPQLAPEEMADLVAYLYPSGTSPNRVICVKGSSKRGQSVSVATPWTAGVGRRPVTWLG